MSSIQQLQDRLQSASAEYQKIQADLTNAVDARQRLDAQKSENELVKAEFDKLSPNSVVYKQIGPVLVQQEQAEAKANVKTRLDFIASEIKRIEGQLAELGEKSEKKKVEIVEIQTQIQRLAQPAAAQASPAPIAA
ncbi:prefoldin subunit 6 [Cristinia sonorae]|uniref:Prefoldin subunit 6 n=1 Tax=Cristinia sonorae TaxID=1940300 RepID=A0A8K0UJD8_9AGAR|nr:prefoldin subunit 6 [Cristinia sonorae]